MAVGLDCRRRYLNTCRGGSEPPSGSRRWPGAPRSGHPPRPGRGRTISPGPAADRRSYAEGLAMARVAKAIEQTSRNGHCGCWPACSSAWTWGPRARCHPWSTTPAPVPAIGTQAGRRSLERTTTPQCFAIGVGGVRPAGGYQPRATARRGIGGQGDLDQPAWRPWSPVARDPGRAGSGIRSRAILASSRRCFEVFVGAGHAWPGRVLGWLPPAGRALPPRRSIRGDDLPGGCEPLVLAGGQLVEQARPRSSSRGPPRPGLLTEAGLHGGQGGDERHP